MSDNIDGQSGFIQLLVTTLILVSFVAGGGYYLYITIPKPQTNNQDNKTQVINPPKISTSSSAYDKLRQRYVQNNSNFSSPSPKPTPTPTPDPEFIPLATGSARSTRFWNPSSQPYYATASALPTPSPTATTRPTPSPSPLSGTGSTN